MALTNKDDLKTAIDLLQHFIDDMAQEIEIIKQNYADCAANMENDVYSQKAKYELYENTLLMKSTVQQAADLKAKIKYKYDHIDN